jgi:hypothetical protein
MGMSFAVFHFAKSIGIPRNFPQGYKSIRTIARTCAGAESLYRTAFKGESDHLPERNFDLIPN